MVAPMEHALPLAGWENFYVIVGSSAAALTGLQFVVITLIGGELLQRSSGTEINAFGTPTVVHFCSVLIGASIMTAPWHALAGPATALAVSSAIGIAYCGVTIRRVRGRTQYQPVLEDWVFHVVLPSLVYLSAFLAAIELPRQPVSALFVISGDSLLLLLIGIHNAWDSVVYVTFEYKKKQS
jgi:hypothetical protein